MTTTPHPDDILDTLAAIDHPTLEEDIVSLDIVEDVELEADTATVHLALNAPFAPAERTIGEAVLELLTTKHDLEVDIRAGLETDEDATLSEIRNIIAVAAGKGGVGKTTVAANLAAGLADRGARVGLLDGDIHGPNVPRALPIDEDVDITSDDRFIPAQSGDIAVMSMGTLLPDRDDPAILRGPMVNDLRTRFLTQVEWGPLDYLIIDLPPGTGDGSLDILQTVQVTGTVVVTTPHPMARDDARKAINMVERHDIPVLGVVENMATVTCPNCDEHHAPFGTDGVDDIVDKYDVPHLGSIPIHPAIGAEPEPIARTPSNPMHGRFTRIADAVLNQVSAANADRHTATDDEEIETPMEPRP